MCSPTNSLGPISAEIPEDSSNSRADDAGASYRCKTNAKLVIIKVD